jgi:vancomycin resistance protein YoaR
MHTTIVSRRSKNPSPPHKYIQALIAGVGGLALFLILLLVALMGFNILHAGKIYPGVSMAGIDLSGLTTGQAADKLSRNLLYPQTGKIVLTDGAKTWVVNPAAIGLSVDYQANALSAYQAGRSFNPIRRIGSQFLSWGKGIDVAPAMVYNEQAALDYLYQIAKEIDIPTKEASLRLEGSEVVAVPGQVGRTLDVDASLKILRAQIETLTDGVLPLVIPEAPPKIMDASSQAETARQIIGQALTLVFPEAKEGDPGPYKIPSSQLAQMLKIERTDNPDGSTITVGLSSEALQTYLNALSSDINISPANARFTLNDDTRKLELIKPAVIGRSLDINATVQSIQDNLARGEHTTKLALAYIQPDVGDNATGEQLGITENIIAYTSYFRGSTAERLQNIKTAAADFHGLLVPPGATFSMAGSMGNVTLDNGYAEALIIFGGKTIKGVGGGVCQVSTTLFRAAFLAGFPIVERHPHAYRVGYYEQTATSSDPDLAGLDATVFVPLVDFKFVNDSPHWLLMETYFYPNSRSLTWKFYSTSDGRKVEWESSGPQNIVDPPDPVYEENPEFSKGEVKQVDWAAEGADVTITRTVYRDGQILFSDSVITHYMPWADVYQYGPGTNLNKLKKKNVPPIIIR